LLFVVVYCCIGSLIKGFFQEPIYQLGLTAKAAAAAAAEKGVQYYSAAGNQFNNSYEAVYKGIPCPPELSRGSFESCHDFGNGNPRQRLDVRVDGNLLLFWDQPWFSISN
jgi:hypothetical protein